MGILNLGGLQCLICEMESDQSRTRGLSVLFGASRSEALFPNCSPERAWGDWEGSCIWLSVEMAEMCLHHWCQIRCGNDPRVPTLFFYK